MNLTDENIMSIFMCGVGAGMILGFATYLFIDGVLKAAKKARTKKLEQARSNDTELYVVGTWNNKNTHRIPLQTIPVGRKHSRRVLETINRTDDLDFAILKAYCKDGFVILHKNATEVTFVGMTDLSDTPLEFTLAVDADSDQFNGRWLLSSIPLENQHGKFTPKGSQLLISTKAAGYLAGSDYDISLFERFTRDEGNTYFEAFLKVATNQIGFEYNQFRESVKAEASTKAATDNKMETWGYRNA